MRKSLCIIVLSFLLLQGCIVNHVHVNKTVFQYGKYNSATMTGSELKDNVLDQENKPDVDTTVKAK